MSTWTLPAAGGISSGYGPRVLAGAVSGFHEGVDLRAKRGPVRAARDGVVRSIWKTAKGAWVVDVRHPDEGGRQVRTRYIHMYRDEIRVVVGQRVAAGDQIGNSGASGTGAAHLHFEVLVNGSPVNPVPFMAVRGVDLNTGTVLAVPVTGGAAPATVPSLPMPPTSEEDDMLTTILWCYTNILGRAPKPQQVIDVVPELAGRTDAGIIAWFLGAQTKNEPEAVQVAYREFLHPDRVASPAEVAGYDGTTVAVMRNLVRAAAARGEH